MSLAGDKSTWQESGVATPGKVGAGAGIEVVRRAPEESSVEGGGNMVFKIVINWHCVL